MSFCIPPCSLLCHVVKRGSATAAVGARVGHCSAAAVAALVRGVSGWGGGRPAHAHLLVLDRACPTVTSPAGLARLARFVLTSLAEASGCCGASAFVELLPGTQPSLTTFGCQLLLFRCHLYLQIGCTHSSTVCVARQHAILKPYGR